MEGSGQRALDVLASACYPFASLASMSFSLISYSLLEASWKRNTAADNEVRLPPMAGAAGLVASVEFHRLGAGLVVVSDTGVLPHTCHGSFPIMRGGAKGRGRGPAQPKAKAKAEPAPKRIGRPRKKLPRLKEAWKLRTLSWSKVLAGGLNF